MVRSLTRVNYLIGQLIDQAFLIMATLKSIDNEVISLRGMMWWTYTHLKYCNVIESHSSALLW